ncbi:MAG: hypothetical protein H7A25_14985 [Leptospiraceae bacterium]|nr:hypothetical protein [Leptospiraceae bacterium]MCP5501206.1 hypothetical protein [Leptospiraceae bacterium]
MTSKPSPHKNFLHSIQSNLEAYVVLSAEPLSPPSDSEVSRFLSLDPGSEDFEHFLCDSGFMNFIAGMEMLSPAKSELPLLESDVLTVRFTPSFLPKATILDRIQSLANGYVCLFYGDPFHIYSYLQKNLINGGLEKIDKIRRVIYNFSGYLVYEKELQKSVAIQA